MRPLEPRWLANSNPLRLFFYLLLPLLLCAGSAYDQSTALQRHYLFPYLESSILRHSMADTVGVRMYLKLSKDRKKVEYLTAADVAPVLVIVGDELPFELSASAHKQKWDHIELGRRVQINSAALAAILETNIFNGESIWELLSPALSQYYWPLCALVLLRLLWLGREEILSWIAGLWRNHQEQSRLIEVQFADAARSLPAPSRPLLPASRPEVSAANALQTRPPKPPANAAGWSPSLWVDRSELTQKDRKTD